MCVASPRLYRASGAEVSRTICACLYTFAIAERQSCGGEVEVLVSMQERVKVKVFQHVTTWHVAKVHVVGMLQQDYILAKPLTTATLGHLPTNFECNQATMRLLRQSYSTYFGTLQSILLNGIDVGLRRHQTWDRGSRIRTWRHRSLVWCVTLLKRVWMLRRDWCRWCRCGRWFGFARGSCGHACRRVLFVGSLSQCQQCT